jgi:hypothetical protein
MSFAIMAARRQRLCEGLITSANEIPEDRREVLSHRQLEASVDPPWVVRGSRSCKQSPFIIFILM